MSSLTLTELSDMELIHLCQTRGAKDDRPFQEMLRRHQKMVWGVCYSFTRNSQDAEDLTQEVFFKVYRNLGKFEGRASLKTWIYRIAINTCQNELRRRNRRPQEATNSVEIMAEYLPHSTNLEAEFQKKAKQEQLKQALMNLEPTAYEVLHLKDLEHRPYAEIATMLDISLSAAKMRVQRARFALQAAYRQLEE